MEKIKKISGNKEAIEGLFEAARALLEKAKALLDEARNNFVDLDLESGRFKDLIDRLKNFCDDLRAGLKEVAINVRKAQGHAKKLMDLAAELDGLLADTRGSAENAVKAAKSYSEIEAAIKKAKMAAEVAVEAAKNATSETGGLDDEARDSLLRSKQLLDEALQTRERVEGNLIDRLGVAKAGVDQVAATNGENRRGIDELKRAMDRLPSRTFSKDAERAAEKSDNANTKAQDALAKVNEFLNRVPKIKEWAEQMPRDIDEANKSIKRSIGQVDKVHGLVPELLGLMDRIAHKAQVNRLLGSDMGDKIAAIRRKIAITRDRANGISVGMRFYPNTTLELRNPEGLHRSATSTKLSFYMNTKEEDGFLAYIGSPVDTHKRVKRSLTDDFMAVEVIDGKVAVTMDLGSGHKKIVNERTVSDGQWHQVLVDRVGRTVTLKVRTEDLEDAEVTDNLPGTFSVFNLDQELSKFYVGGFPSSENIQQEITQFNFNGGIETVMFDEKPVGLWNFVNEQNTEGDLERDKLVILTDSGRGVQLNGMGYVVLEKKRFWKFQKTVEVIFRFKTFADNGLLFLIGKGNKYYSIELINGNIVNQLNLGTGPSIINASKTYNDGQWHSVDAARQGRDAVLKIDGKEVGRITRASGRSEDLDFTNLIYIGGYPQNHDFPGVTNADFEGCIESFQIGSTVIDLNSNKEALGLLPGCPVKISRSVSFAEDSSGHIGMPSMALGEEPQFTFRFKTVKPNGLLFYAANREQTNYISLSLYDGGLALRAKPGGDVQSGVSARYNDGWWHYVSATKNNSHLQLVIDDFDVIESRATAIGEIVTTTPLYFGGVPSNLALATGASQSEELFIGCIGDVTINGKFQNFADARVRVGPQLINCPMSDPQAVIGDTYKTGYEIAPILPPVTQSPSTRPKPPTTSRTTPATAAPTTTVATTTTTTTTPTPTTARTTRRPMKQGVCKLPMHPQGDPNFSDSDGIRFGNTLRSREEYHIVTSKLKSNIQIALDFKTKAKDGVLFYVADSAQMDFFAAYIKEGKVIFTFNLGSGKLEITSPQRYNDGQWHSTEFTRVHTEGKLVIDGVQIGTDKSPGSSKTMNVANPLYLGGTIAHKSIKLNLQNVDTSFNGCIRNVKFNKEPRPTPTLKESVSPCSENVEMGAFFGADGGYLVVYDNFRVGLEKSINIEIKPRNLSGVLLAVQDKKHKDFLLLHMVDGTIKFSVDNGIGIISTSYKSPSIGYLCDGEWHTIRAVKNKNVVTLSVDGKYSVPGIGVAGVSATDTNDPLYIGGVPTPSHFKALETTSTFPQYVGCIRNLQIDNQELSLLSARTSGTVTTGTCPTV